MHVRILSAALAMSTAVLPFATLPVTAWAETPPPSAAIAPVPAPDAAAQRAMQATAVPSMAEVMAVPDGLKALVHERVVAPGGGREERLRRLVELVFGDDGMALEYDNQTTRTVAQAWQDGRANCLSFTLLFVAIAREAGLEAHVQEVGEVLAWYQEQGVIYNANHVNVGVRGGGERQTVDLDRNILASRNRPRRISDIRAMAHFHNNRGAERMAAGDLEGARVLLRAAVADDADFVPAWNNLGVVLLRQGDMRGAEQAYLAALRLNPEHGATLSNLVAMYRRAGDTRQAGSYAWRLEKAQRDDPFHQFMRALECESHGDYGCAIVRYRSAIRLQGGEHQFHFGLARAYFLAGEPGPAQREFGRAYTLGGTEQVRSVYRQKLDHLRRWRERSAGQAGTAEPR